MERGEEAREIQEIHSRKERKANWGKGYVRKKLNKNEEKPVEDCRDKPK